MPVDEAEAIIVAGWVAIIEAECPDIMDGLAEPIIGLSLAIIVGDWLIIGDAVLEVEDAGDEEDEWQPARVSASTRPPPTGASRARERPVRMGASFS
jgi:hypothetical protein